MSRARVAQDGDDAAALGEGHGGHDGGHAVDGAAAADEEAVLLGQGRVLVEDAVELVLNVQSIVVVSA